jgi:L-alanine-DL-glutamate epimerase-like enolase superfamily enzyme
MKIRSVVAHPLQYPEPHDHNNIRYVTLVRIATEDGAVGWGECISQFPESSLAVKTIVELGYQPLLLGEDPNDVERLWHKLLSRIWWYGPQGIAGFALSAVDMALWDLKGKALGLPVMDLLGGALNENVGAMASIHFDMEDPSWNVKEFKWFRNQNYRIVKGGWGKRPDAVFGFDHKRDLDLVRRIREVIGDDIELVVDVLGARVRWDVATAIQRVHSFEPYRLKWIEEPLPPHDLEGYKRLRNSISTNVGSGEQEWNVEGYRRLIRSGGVDIVQMDPGRCLGITGCAHVIKLIEAENLHFTMHSWSSALNTAASIQLLATSTHGVCMDFKPHESPMQHELVTDPWVQQNGFVAVRRTPGLGVTIREQTVNKYEYCT